jgi:hypothetical protein
MALANINSYRISPDKVRASDPNYSIALNALVNQLTSKVGINLTVRTPISNIQMGNLSQLLNSLNNSTNSVAMQLVSLIARYIPKESDRKSFVEANTMKRGSTNLQWNGKTMMWYRLQNQLYMDAASVIQKQVAGRTSFNLLR